jgi:hypothetical protein
LFDRVKCFYFFGDGFRGHGKNGDIPVDAYHDACSLLVGLLSCDVVVFMEVGEVLVGIDVVVL